MTEPRTDNQILDGVVPGATQVTLGGRVFPMREPNVRRGRRVLAALSQYQIDAQRGDAEAMEAMEVCMDQLLENFSEEIAQAKEWILDNATHTEALDFWEKVNAIMYVPFLNAAAKMGATLPQNRAARRSAKKSGDGSTKR